MFFRIIYFPKTQLDILISIKTLESSLEIKNKFGESQRFAAQNEFVMSDKQACCCLP